MVTLAVVVAMLLVTVLLGLIANVGRTVSQKIEVQNAADASTYAAATWMARGMNAITTANHVIGELMAVVVLVHSFGGERYDGDGNHRYDSPEQASIANELLAMSYQLAQIANPVPMANAYHLIHEAEREIKAGSSILQSKIQLKFLTVAAYCVHFIGGVLQKIPLPPLMAIGQGLVWSSWVAELKFYQEYLVLEFLEEQVLGPVFGVNGIKRKIIESLPTMMAYERRVVRVVPPIALAAAAQLARENGCTGTLHPKPGMGLRLPVAEEAKRVPIEFSQLMRASYPWVVYWRDPIVKSMMATLTFSGAPFHYIWWSQLYAREKTEKTRKDQGLYLYVMVDMVPPNSDKGNELWTHDSGRAEQLFTLVGLTHREVGPLFADKYFGGAHPYGILCCAQAILYNANHQDRQGTRGWQPRVAWDTLNWNTEVPYVPLYEYRHGPPPQAAGEPQIKLNWQVKLVPLTRLNEAALLMEPPFSMALRRLVPDVPSLRTH